MELKLLRPEETDRVLPLLEELAAYHNEVALYRELTYPSHPLTRTMENIRTAVEKGTSEVCAAVEGDEICGVCILAFDKESDQGDLQYLYVREACRGKGFGGALMDWAIARFRSRGIAVVNLHVVDGNPAETLYEKYGFHPRLKTMTRRLEPETL